MQTFVPYSSFDAIAQCLDYRRLGKQRVEAHQILQSLEFGPGHGWYHHPAVQMWFGRHPALRQYMGAMIREWIRRGYKNTMHIPRRVPNVRMPDWWGGPIHASHRAALLHKAPEHYKQFGWTEKPELNCYWPTKE